MKRPFSLTHLASLMFLVWSHCLLPPETSASPYKSNQLGIRSAALASQKRKCVPTKKMKAINKPGRRRVRLQKASGESSRPAPSSIIKFKTL
ncbi:uncharacterized protein K460DRAFT_362890 [Cucurbitaria berberidis CBS 394.84]|uniref:Secreted protein n=1 Tax=Cucurbitaria berberidis CBS 394.84 TaxID=1168544 RepID=A0A9P4LFI9_9PLEO|nr:uncharacterized protein K460DRAFT_362890 [Cucurbitaria berberidis CBS 394.84]KAF1852124.1 hypothetical protein K460DRAFT_362890 [Cucurbitaria berberidis CBS 394.84]